MKGPGPRTGAGVGQKGGLAEGKRSSGGELAEEKPCKGETGTGRLGREESEHRGNLAKGRREAKHTGECGPGTGRKIGREREKRRLSTDGGK